MKYNAGEDREESTVPHSHMSPHRDFEIIDAQFPYIRHRLSKARSTKLMLPDYSGTARLMAVLSPLRGSPGDGRTIQVFPDDTTKKHLFACSNFCGGRMVLQGDRSLRFSGSKGHMEVTECEPCTCPKLMNHANKRCGYIQESSPAEARLGLLRCLVHEFGIAVHDYTHNPPPGYTSKGVGTRQLRLFENKHPDALAQDDFSEHFFGKLADGKWFDIPLAKLGGEQESWMPMLINHPREVSTKLYSAPATTLTEETLTSETSSEEAGTDDEDTKLPAREAPGTHACQVCLIGVVTCRLVCGWPTSSVGCPGVKLCQSCCLHLLSTRRPQQAISELDTTWWLDNRETRYAACPLNCGRPVRFMKSPPEAAELTNITHMIPCFFAVERPYYCMDDLASDWWAFDFYAGPIAKSRKSITVEMERLQHSLESLDHRGNHPISATRDHQQQTLKLDIQKQKHFLDQTRYPRWAEDWNRDYTVPPKPAPARLPRNPNLMQVSTICRF